MPKPKIRAWPAKLEITHAPSDAFCPVCGLLVAFEASARRLAPVAHRAPICGRWCAGGGVDRDAYMLGAIHRSRGCGACGVEDGDE